MKHSSSTNGPANRPSVDQPDDAALNGHSLMRLGMAFGFALAMATTAPPGLTLALLNTLLFMCAFFASAAAAVMGDSLFAPHLTRWDEAVILAVASQLTAWFVDPVAVQAALEAAQQINR